MPRIVVLFNLKQGIDPDTYENWARTIDAPTVSGLPSVSGFTVHRATGILGSDQCSPYDYIEVLDVRTMDGLIEDIGTDAMKAIATDFQGFAENPLFIVTEDLA